MSRRRSTAKHPKSLLSDCLEYGRWVDKEQQRYDNSNTYYLHYLPHDITTNAWDSYYQISPRAGRDFFPY